MFDATTSSDKILAVVTGSFGFVGSAIAIHFLDLGHSVRLPVRTPQHAEAWLEQHGGKYKERIEPVVLEASITEKGVFDRILEGCDVLVHSASPSTFTIETAAETDILEPALAGTLSILESDCGVRRRGTELDDRGGVVEGQEGTGKV